MANHISQWFVHEYICLWVNMCVCMCSNCTWQLCTMYSVSKVSTRKQLLSIAALYSSSTYLYICRNYFHHWLSRISAPIPSLIVQTNTFKIRIHDVDYLLRPMASSLGQVAIGSRTMRSSHPSISLSIQLYFVWGESFGF